MSMVEFRFDAFAEQYKPQRAALLIVDGQNASADVVVDLESHTYTVRGGDRAIMSTTQQPARVQRDDGMMAYIWRGVEVTA